VNWCNKGACTPIKNQGQCGSCWAFSVTEQIESDNFLQKGSLPVLSPQR
jgi:C1A family cysteine protease